MQYWVNVSVVYPTNTIHWRAFLALLITLGPTVNLFFGGGFVFLEFLELSILEIFFIFVIRQTDFHFLPALAQP